MPRLRFVAFLVHLVVPCMLMSAAGLSRADDLVEKAKALAAEKKHPEAFALYKQAAEQDDKRAYFPLAECYSYGIGTTEDLDAAVKWYQKSANLNHPDAAYQLGYIYLNYLKGQNGQPDYLAASKWSFQAAERGRKYAASLLENIDYELSKPKSSAAADSTRVISGFGEPITILSLPGGEVELHDENDRSRYSTDPYSGLIPLTKEANGDLSYTNERGDLVTVHANDERSVTIPKHNLTIREALDAAGNRFTREFTFSGLINIYGQKMQGRWTRENSQANIWQKIDADGQPFLENGTQVRFDGNLELSDYFRGEYRVVNHLTHYRGTDRRDGYSKTEKLDSTNKRVISTVENFPDGRAGRRGPVNETVDITHATGTQISLAQDENGVITTLKLPDGTVLTRRGPHQWTNADGRLFYDEVERVGVDTIRLYSKQLSQALTWRGDGSWTQELMTEKFRLTPDGRVQPSEEPEFTIHVSPSGSATVVDGRDGSTYSTSSVSETFRLTRDPKNQSLTFIEQSNAHWQITIYPDGSRRFVADKGQGLRFDTNAAGRVLYQYDAAGNIQTIWSYRDLDNGQVALSEFADASRQHWRFTGIDPASGQQRWELQNGPPGEPAATMMADEISVDRQSSLVTRTGHLRTIKKIDGSVITERRFYLDEKGERRPLDDPSLGRSRPTIVEIAVADGKSPPAYMLTTDYGADSKRLKQELKLKDTTYVRGGPGQDFEQMSWHELDASGQLKPGDDWMVGECFIDDHGTFIRRQFEWEPVPDRPGGRRPKMQHTVDGTDVPILMQLMYFDTSGESEQYLPHGGVIRRTEGGLVEWVRDANGDFTSFQYESADENSVRISAVNDHGERWLRDKNGAYIRDVEGTVPNLSSFKFDVDPKTGTITRTTDDENIYVTRVDGTTRIERANDQQIELNAAGQVVNYVDGATKNTYAIVYGADGQVVRADSSQGLVIADPAYDPPADNPLPEKGVLRARKIQVDGPPTDKYVAYVNEAGRAIHRSLLSAASDERENAQSDDIVWAKSAAHFTVFKDGWQHPDDPTDPNWSEQAQEILGWRGTGSERVLEYTTADGQRVERLASGAVRRFDPQGRLVESRAAGEGEHDATSLPDVIQYQYANADSPHPGLVRSRQFVVGLNKKEQRAVHVILAADGKAVLESRDVKLFYLSAKGDLVVQYANAGSRARMVLNTRTGDRTELAREGRRTVFDSRGRMTETSDAWGNSCQLFYETHERVPTKIIVLDPFRKSSEAGVWQRASGTATADSDVYSWKEQDSDKTLERAVFADDGQFVFVGTAATTGANVDGPTAALTFQFDDNKNLSGVVRTVTTHDQYKIVTTFSRSTDGAWKDSDGNYYDSAVVIDNGTGACLMNYERILALARDGSSVETNLDSDYVVEYRVFRDELNGYSSRQDCQGKITHPLHNNDDQVVGIGRAPDIITQTKDEDEFQCSATAKDHTFQAWLNVDARGNEFWRGYNDVLRTVYEDGSVTVILPNGARILFAADGSHNRYIYTSGNEVRQVVARRDGRIEVEFDNGTMAWQDPLSDEIRYGASADETLKDAPESDPVERGRLELLENGDVALWKSEANELIVYHFDGRRTQFTYQSDVGWTDVETGQVYVSREELARRLGQRAARGCGRRCTLLDGTSQASLTNGLDLLYRPDRGHSR